MKKGMLGLTLIFLLVIVACSSNNTSENNQAIESAVEEAPIVEQDEHMGEHVAEPVEGAKPAVKPEAEAEVEAVEPEVAPEPAPVVAMAKTHKVEIVNFAFSPASLEISVGDIVEFTNLDAVKHSAVEDNGMFDTGLLAKGESKLITFSEAGEFAYYCGPHPDMRASIIVE
ncbi:MAG: cupredoxin family copper-binding protein [Paenibacillaceae bacterium]